MSLLSLDQIKTLYDDLRGRIEDGGSVINFLPVDNASGSIATFPDGADDVPVKSLVAQITPVQDLHGQSAPYPAGGGKNKFNPTADTTTISPVTFTAEKIGSQVIGYKASGTPSATCLFNMGSFALKSGETYILSGSPSGASDSTFRIDARVNGSAYNNWNDGSNATFTATEDITVDIYIRIAANYAANNLVFRPMIRLSSVSDPTFAPYSNECPISGWTGAKITDTGINIWDEEWVDGYWDATDGSFVSSVGVWRASKNFIPCSPNTTYFRKMEETITASAAGVLFYDADKTYINYINVAKNTTFTTPSNAYYMTFYANANFFSYPLSINYPSTDTSYHSGTSNKSVDVSWADEGAVYGGTLTYIGGGKYSLQATHAVTDLGLNNVWNASGSSGLFLTYSMNSIIKFPPSTQDAADMVCEKYATAAYATAPDMSIYTTWETAGTKYVAIKDPTHAGEDGSTFRTSLEGVKLVFRLATLPDPIILDAEDVKTLLGDNNIFVDTGDVSVDYRADIALYIQKVVNA